MYDKSKYEHECFKIAQAFKKVLNSGFDDKVYKNFENTKKRMKLIGNEHFDKITNIVSANRNFRPIDIIVFC